MVAVDNNKFTIQRIYIYAGTSNTYITYGQTQYANLTDAKAAIPNEEPIIDPILIAESSLRSYLIVQQGTTALNDTDTTYFKPAGKLGEPIGGGAAGGDIVGPGVAVNNSLVRFDGTTGKIVKDGANIVATDAGNIGIGTTDPQAQLHSVISTNNSSGVGIMVDVYGTSSGAGLIGRRARGTSSSASNVSANDSLTYISARGYGATGFSSAGRASMIMYAAENWTDTAQGTYISLQTTSIGDTTRTERVRIDDEGDVSITGDLSVSGVISGVVVGKANVVTITTSYSITTANEIVLANTSSNTITVTLPTSIGNSGKEYVIKNIGASNTNSVVVTTSLSQTIDGETSQSYNYPNSMTVVSDNANWWII